MKDFRVETILNCEDEQRNASSADDSDAKDGNVPAYKLEETNLSERRRQQALKPCEKISIITTSGITEKSRLYTS